MSETKKRVLVAGLLVLCLVKLLWHDYRRPVIGLSELVAMSGAWACAVWLWNWDAATIRSSWSQYSAKRKARNREQLLQEARRAFLEAKFTEDEVCRVFEVKRLDDLPDEKLAAIPDRAHGWHHKYWTEVKSMKNFMKINGFSDDELTRICQAAWPRVGSWRDLNFVILSDLRPLLLKKRASAKNES